MAPKTARFRAEDLVLVAPAHRWKNPPRIGAVVQLNSGGPDMLVVALDHDMRTCAWRHDDGLTSEFEFSYRMLKPSGQPPASD